MSRSARSHNQKERGDNKPRRYRRRRGYNKRNDGTGSNSSTPSSTTTTAQDTNEQTLTNGGNEMSAAANGRTVTPPQQPVTPVVPTPSATSTAAPATATVNTTGPAPTNPTAVPATVPTATNNPAIVGSGDSEVDAILASIGAPTTNAAALPKPPTLDELKARVGAARTNPPVTGTGAPTSQLLPPPAATVLTALNVGAAGSSAATATAAASSVTSAAAAITNAPSTPAPSSSALDATAMAEENARLLAAARRSSGAVPSNTTTLGLGAPQPTPLSVPPAARETDALLNSDLEGEQKRLEAEQNALASALNAELKKSQTEPMALKVYLETQTLAQLDTIIGLVYGSIDTKYAKNNAEPLNGAYDSLVAEKNKLLGRWLFKPTKADKVFLAEIGYRLFMMKEVLATAIDLSLLPPSFQANTNRLAALVTEGQATKTRRLIAGIVGFILFATFTTALVLAAMATLGATSPAIAVAGWFGQTVTEAALTAFTSTGAGAAAAWIAGATVSTAVTGYSMYAMGTSTSKLKSAAKSTNNIFKVLRDESVAKPKVSALVPGGSLTGPQPRSTVVPAAATSTAKPRSSSVGGDIELNAGGTPGAPTRNSSAAGISASAAALTATKSRNDANRRRDDQEEARQAALIAGSTANTAGNRRG